ncbi:MAG: hypothetical protein OXM55_03095 [Bdellovibrionales bacterium]|nr:hypothetical protein [Bdellovibrionales bacterium]
MFICSAYGHDLTKIHPHPSYTEDRLYSNLVNEESDLPSSSFPQHETPSVTLRGDVPFFEFPHLQEQSNSIWAFIKRTVNLPPEVPSPVIYFFPFEKQKQDQQLIAWQKQWIENNSLIWTEYIRYEKNSPSTITPEWIADFLENSLPFPKRFMAYHYDNTNYIQIDPKRVFLSYYQNDPYGVKRDMVGLGFYIMGHEMLHYAFQEKGIFPGEDHHCLFTLPLLPDQQSVLSALSRFLIDNEISFSGIELFGLKKEKDLQPCRGKNDLLFLQKAIALQLSLPSFKEL